MTNEPNLPAVAGPLDRLVRAQCTMQASLDLPPTGKFSHAHKDVVFTPPAVAAGIVAHFRPGGRMLDPCRGDGAFWRHMPGADWCEIQDGRDFFQWAEPVDWIISNPPYSVFAGWLRHSFAVADNIVYLIPINKAFNSTPLLDDTHAFGGIAEIVHVATGRAIGMPFGYAIGAVHYKRGHRGAIKYRHGL